MMPALNPLRFCVLLATVLTVSWSVLAPMAAAQDRPYTISVSGQAEIRTAPDMATVWFGVVTRDKHPDEARRLNADAAAAAMNAVRALGIPERDIRLETIQLQPLREYDPDRRVYREEGFEATRNVEVTVRNLDLLPDLMAAIVNEGANRINSIQYGLENKDAAELDALKQAARVARVKAGAIAAELGLSLGSAIQINEQGVFVPQPRMQMEMASVGAMAKDAGNPDAFAAGELTVSASLTVAFSLTDQK
ncbi:MAG: SIMPL domain-containing protein [Bacteroidetes bacterium]|nr:SIMPL domain-containing protein [Bacteroidota bacterium]MDA0875114.1 SIMPL domain-containing protein [Bacteroidota bacterium]MDA1334061.1 SIMPL domain-containing protein [Bacteroidota bacterium]